MAHSSFGPLSRGGGVRVTTEKQPSLISEGSATMNGASSNSQSENSQSKSGANAGSFRLVLSVRFVILSFLSAVFFSFAIGRVCRHILLQSVYVKESDEAARNLASVGEHHQPVLPQPVLPGGKEYPHSTYTSKQFDNGVAASSDSVLLSRRADVKTDFQNVAIMSDGSIQGLTQEHIETLHEPAGQHLLVDIEHVDGAFLNSEERLAEAMMNLVSMSGLTLLSYHCHALLPTGVSCVGILLESHVSFHTWPVPGVITLDLFTCGESQLLPLVEDIEALFGVPQPKVEGVEWQPPHTQWAFKGRGFQNEENVNPERVDLDQFLLGWLDMELKDQVAHVQTPFQEIQIFDVINPRFRHLETYHKSLSNDGSYEALHPELFEPDRIVYLDSIMQSRRYGEKVYHEVLVHPALFAHENPKRVAIIGGGEGATLREVLKHNTIEKVTMVEIDEMMVNVSRTYLPKWSDCSNLVGSTPSCFDDPRAEVFYTDAIAWFIERFGRHVEFDEKDRYDVIIMDALDPSSVVEFSDVLYNNDELSAALSRSLTDEGILVAQVGETNFITDPATEFSKAAVVQHQFMRHLQSNGFEKVTMFEEGGQANFMAPWQYMIAFKDQWSLENWFLNDAFVNIAIRDRILPTKNGESALKYFDGGTMQALQYPSRIDEDLFCRRIPTPELCENGHGFAPEKPNIPITSLEVRHSPIPGAGRGLFFKEAAPKGSYIAIDAGVHDLSIFPYTRRILREMLDEIHGDKWKMFETYVFGYGFAHEFYGEPGYSVDASIMTFINHGCNGTNNMGVATELTELTADLHNFPPELENSVLENFFYHPFAMRNHFIYQNAFDTLLRDVSADTELLDNYLGYLHSGNWEWGVLNYRSQCLQQGLGVVSDYETSRSTE